MLWEVLPFFCLMGTILLYPRTHGFFDALVKGSLLWGLFIVLSTYSLSFFSLLYSRSLFFIWLPYAFALTALLLVRRKRLHLSVTLSKSCIPFIIILLVTLATGILYPPNNWDSMTYHLPKVMHWLQNHSLAPYPTAISRQISLAPFAEIVLLHIYGLSGEDYFFNAVQWLAFLGMSLVAAAIAGQLGAGSRGRLAAAFFVATLPMAIIQASSTQTDNVVGFWLACCAYCFLAWHNTRRMSDMLYFGLSLGLAILTKGTAYPLALPFVSFIGWQVLKHPRRLIFQGVLAACLVIGLNLPHLYGTFKVYDNILGAGEHNIISVPTPITFMATLTANILSNDPTWWGKGGLERGYSALFEALGIPRDDPVVFPWGGINLRSGYSTHEDNAQNPFHTLFLILILGAYLFRSLSLPKLYTRCVMAALVFFCLFLTWQPWITRLQVPIFVFAAPLFGITFETIRTPGKKKLVLIGLILTALPPLFFLQSRPLLPSHKFHTRALTWTTPREDLYFSNRPELMASYKAAADSLAEANPSCIGLKLDGDSWEYPLWVLLRQKMKTLPRIVHLTDDNEKSLQPEYLFVLDQHMPQETSFQHGHPQAYRKVGEEYRKMR